MQFSKTFFGLAALISLAIAQDSASQFCDSTGLCFQRYTDQELGVSVSLAAPTTDSGEFILEVSAPSNFGWAGVALGPNFNQNMMLATWANNEDTVVSSRMTHGFTAPVPFTGPTLVPLPGTEVRDGFNTARFRCVGCTNWTGGSLNMDETVTLTWAASVAPQVLDKTNPQAAIPMFQFSDSFQVDIPAAKTASYNTFLKRSLPPHSA